MSAYTLWKELDGLSGSLLNPVVAPRVDVIETKLSYELTAELPGFKRDEVTVQVKDGVLELTANQPEDKSAGEQEAETRWLLRERRTAVFQRTFRLPRDVDAESIEAAFRDGLLVLTLPKKEEVKPRQVVIKTA
jgi:HSP20 family protein